MDESTSDPDRHAEAMARRLDDLAGHLRKDIEHVDDPRFRALAETAEEVLDGLGRAFIHFREGEETAWR